MNYLFVLFFYVLIIFLIYYNRKKFEIHAKFIALYRTKIGINWMKKISQIAPSFWKWWAYIGVVIGYIGLLVISFVLIKGLFDLFLVPEAPASISIVLPGVKIPGSSIFIPFWSGLISIFIVASIHEFAHGVISKLYNIRVKSSGIVFFGPIIGAFVEPDETVLKKAPKIQQLSIFAAGPFSNICLGFLILALMLFVLFPFASSIVEPQGIEIMGVKEGFPAELSGIKEGDILTRVDGKIVYDLVNFSKELSLREPGKMIILSTDKKNYLVNLTFNPDNKSLSYVGINLNQKIGLKDGVSNLNWGLFYLIDFLKILFMLTMGIGLANLLPLGPVDGGRMLQVGLYQFFEKNRADLIWQKVSVITLLVLFSSIVIPIFRSIF